ncbi:MAG: TetR/AcrR family transcriptional regulator [Acidobacteriota bacterium]|nr:TetR/AcrR family transcriptional regulator [Acidobacteriota bacterium]
MNKSRGSSQTRCLPAVDCHPRGAYRPGILRVRKLMDAAAALFMEHGISETTIDDIVARAGIAKATFYHYFASKHALLDALREDLIERCNTQILQAVSACPEDDLHQRLMTWVRSTAETRIHTMAIADVVFSEEGCPLHWTVSGEPFMKYIVALLQKGNRCGAWSVKKPALAATLFFHGMFGVQDDVILRGGDPKSVTADIVDFALQAVYGRPAAHHSKP